MTALLLPTIKLRGSGTAVDHILDLAKPNFMILTTRRCRSSDHNRGAGKTRILSEMESMA
jgi:hypothetical protein